MSVRLSSLRERLRESRLVGTFVKLPALEAVEICAQTLDFAVVDLEHSQLADGAHDPTRVAATAAITTAEISGAVTPSDWAIRPGSPIALRRRPRPSRSPRPSSWAEASM